MSEPIFAGACKGSSAEYPTVIDVAACGGLVVTQNDMHGDEDHVLLSDEACEAIAQYIRGDE
jgi:hypothetical protein